MRTATPSAAGYVFRTSSRLRQSAARTVTSQSASALWASRCLRAKRSSASVLSTVSAIVTLCYIQNCALSNMSGCQFEYAVKDRAGGIGEVREDDNRHG